MIAFLARRRWGRLALIPVIIAASAWSWLTIADGTQNEQDHGRTLNWWGWLDPRLDPEWTRFAGSDSRYHLLKNMGSEWAKLDGQRAFKSGSFVAIGWGWWMFALGVGAAFLLSGCAHFDRDPLAIYRIDPRAFTMPVTTFAVLPF